MHISRQMVDLSSNNHVPSRADLKAHYDAGRRVICLKATQGNTYTWTTARALTAEWHKLGRDAIVWRYAFNGTTGRPSAQATYFAREIAREWRKGDRWILDVEAIPVGAGRFEPSFSGSQATEFQHRMHELEPDWESGIYGGPYLLRDRGVKPHHGAILMLADYASHIAFIPPGWTQATLGAWQYTNRATGVPGIEGAVDQSTLSPFVLPPEHRSKPAASPLHHRKAALALLHELEHAGRPLSNDHDGRKILKQLGHEIDRTLARKAA